MNPQTTIVTYKVDDGTAQIDVQRWIPPDRQDQPLETYDVDSFVRVFGIIKGSNNKRTLNADSVRLINDYNEVNYHMLEATYVHLQMTRGATGGQAGAGAGGDGDSMFVDGGAGYGAGSSMAPTKLGSCSAAAKRIFQLINTTPGGNEGIHLNMVTSSLNMSVRDVLSGADELLGQGLIYTTVDDETWAILEY
jgi:replication factor A2